MLSDKDGYCDQYNKNIAINMDYDTIDNSFTRNLDAHIAKIKRHEIIHAYFAESGLSEQFDDELIVDWLAWQFPKILKTFMEVNALPENLTSEYFYLDGHKEE